MPSPVSGGMNRPKPNCSGCAATAPAKHAKRSAVRAAPNTFPVEEDVGHTVRVEETAENAAGPGAPATSTQTAAVVPPIPVNTTPPKIAGTAQQGKELNATPGAWEYHPTELKYQWMRCNGLGEACFPIAGADETKYMPVPEDVGSTLRVSERAKNAGGESAPVESVQTAEVLPAPPLDVAPPTITGIAQQGKELVEHHGNWENNPTSYKYEWLRCNQGGGECTAIAGAKEAPNLPIAADVGHTIRVKETAKNVGGSGAPVTSTQTEVVVPPIPVNVAAPTISGEHVQGKTLTEVHGSWEYNPTEYLYQWLRCNETGGACTEISGATEQTYLLSTADAKHTIEVGEIAKTRAAQACPPYRSPPPRSHRRRP